MRKHENLLWQIFDVMISSSEAIPILLNLVPMVEETQKEINVIILKLCID